MFCPLNDSFCKSLQILSSNVWHDLQDAITYNSPLHEESITQYNSLELNRRHKFKNRIHQFSKRKESKNGADWMWMFYDPGTLNYIGAAVQAKRLYETGKYDALSLNQAQKLIRYSNLLQFNNVVPLYIFYNHPGIRFSRPEFYRKLNRIGSFRYLDPPADLGCTFLHAQHLIYSGILRSTKPFDLSPHMRPWWHLACKCSLSSGKDSPTDELQQLSKILQSGLLSRPDFFIDPTQADGPLREWLMGEELPDGKLEHLFGLDEINPEDPDAFSPEFVLVTKIGKSESEPQ